jgi:hypothetical protein
MAIFVSEDVYIESPKIHSSTIVPDSPAGCRNRLSLRNLL